METRSAQVLAELANDLYMRLPKPIDLGQLRDQQFQPAIISAIMELMGGASDITAQQMAGYQSMGGTDHCDPTLSGSPIASERPYHTGFVVTQGIE